MPDAQIATCPYLFCFAEIDVGVQTPDTGGQVFICPECEQPSYPNPDGGLMTAQKIEEILVLLR